MQNATIKTCDSESKSSDKRKVGIKAGLKIIVTGLLLLATTSAMAGVTYLQVAGQYANAELAQVDVQDLSDDIVRIHTTGLNGELSLKGSDFPPEYGVPASATGKFQISQELELVINLSLGVVEGRAIGQIHVSNENMFAINGNSCDSAEVIQLHADVRGNASCLPRNGLECGQLVVDLELHGALSEPYNPASVGQIRKKMLGSLVVDADDRGIWAAMSSNASLGVNEVLMSAMTGLSGGDLCQK